MPKSIEHIRSVVIEDEGKARETLVTLLTAYCPIVDIVGEAASVEDAVSVIRETNPDLVFLDVELSGGTGFEVLERVKPFDFAIIFTTAYGKYEALAKAYPRSMLMFKPLGIKDVVGNVIELFRKR